MTTEEQIQRYKELLGLIPAAPWRLIHAENGEGETETTMIGGPDDWQSCQFFCFGWEDGSPLSRGPLHTPGHEHNHVETVLSGDGWHGSGELVIESEVAEFVEASRNLAQPMLDAWEENQIYAGVVADWVGYTHRARAERDAALERERVLEALLSLAMPFLYDADHDISEARALAEEIKQALTPEPEPCGECGGMGYRYRPVAPGDEDNERFPCPKCQQVAEGG